MAIMKPTGTPDRRRTYRRRLYLLPTVLNAVGVLQRVQGLESPLPRHCQSMVLAQATKQPPTASSTTFSRRSWFASVAAVASSCPASSALIPLDGGVGPGIATAAAAVTDETDRFAGNWWDSTVGSPAPATTSSPTPSRPPPAQATASDEVRISVPKSIAVERGGLGLELAEIEFRTMLRVYVKSVAPGSLASELGIQKDWIAVSVNGQSVERTNTRGVVTYLTDALRPGGNGNRETIDLVFRDPSVFREKLQTLSSDEVVTTQVAPAGETTQRTADGSIQTGRSVTTQNDQRVTVAQLVPPKLCHKGAAYEDLLEISYVGRVAETGQIFDGSAVLINDQGIPGRGNDVSLYFVLGKQPFGQFPPGWDVGLVGQCVGERRRLLIPPALAYGPNGLPRRGIPPDATLQYDITLVSLNGLSTPQ